MPILTTSDGPIEFRYDTAAAPANAASRGSIGIRTQAANVGVYVNTDATATGWRQFMTAGGTFVFPASGTWTLVAATAAALSIGSAANPGMLVFNTAGPSVESNVRLSTTDGVAAGTARIVGGTTAVSAVASAAVANVQAIFSTGSYAIPANTFKANTHLHLKGLIGVTAVSGAGATLQITLHLGGLAGTLVLDFGALGGGGALAANQLATLEIALWCRTAGAGGTLTGWGRLTIGAVNAALAFDQLDVAGSVAGTYTVAVNTTAANTLDVAAVTDAAGTTVVMQSFDVKMHG